MEKTLSPISQALQAIHEHTPFDGWTDKALQEAMRSLGKNPMDAYLLFPRGVDDAVEHFFMLTQEKMQAALDASSVEDMRIRDRIALGVTTRLSLYAPYKASVKQLASYYALHPLCAARHLAKTVDAIWYAAGDRSSDMNYYSKRTLLGAVYSSSYLYWLEDSSDDMADTKAFVQRRIDDVMKIEKLKSQAKKSGIMERVKRYAQ